MRIVKWVGIAIAITLIAAAGFYGYLGGFAAVKVERGTFGPAEIIYATHVGPYQKIGESWKKFQKDWAAAGLKTCDGLGVYLDPPDAPPEKLRSILGCRIDALSESEKAAIKAKFPSLALPQSDTLVATFPFKNYASFMLAPMKVYPELGKRMAQDKIEPVVAIEIYGAMDAIKEIRFVIPVGVDKSAYQPLFDAFPT